MPFRTDSPSEPPVPDRIRRASLAVLCAGTLMTILDGNIVTVAMPAIQQLIWGSRGRGWPGW